MPIPKGNKKTDAQRKAQNKWQAANESTLGCKLKKPIADQFRLYAQQNDTTVSALLSKFVKDALDAAGMLPAHKAPADPAGDNTGDQYPPPEGGTNGPSPDTIQTQGHGPPGCRSCATAPPGGGILRPGDLVHF